MPCSEVYFSNLRTSFKENFLGKLVRLLDTCGLEKVIRPRNLVAVKLHFGEQGSSGFIRPVFVQSIVDRVKGLGALPFLADTNTLYAGTRGNSVSHLHTAFRNGFAYSVVHAPLIIGDGLRGASFSEVKVGHEHVDTAYLGKEIVEADVLLGVAHFKGHELTGFGGTLKNLGMGCASRKGKLEQHSGLAPKVKRKKCIGCGECIEHCAQNAIELVQDRATIDAKRCVGCGECIIICERGAINVRWNKDLDLFQQKMVEYSAAALMGKEEKCLFLNFLTHISPGCDCHDYSDAPIVQDIGVVASRDPVAIDQASVDLVNAQAVSRGSCLEKGEETVSDKFKALYPRVDWTIQLEHGEKIGLGSRKYKLITI